MTAAMAWLPIFFLFFSEHLSLREVLLLEAVYYLSVVILEVPSGYFSDKVGRKTTLILSSTFFLIAYCVFGFSTTFFNLSIAQFLLAAAMAFRSGTDTSFYYESLAIAGRESEFPEREAQVQSMIQLVSACAVLVGGFLGSHALNWPYFLSAIFVFPTLIMSLSFTEPEQINNQKTPSFFKQMNISIQYLRNSKLLWLFAYSILIYVLTHISYEFYQPYLRLLETDGQLKITDAAIASGILFAITRIAGAWSAKMSVKWSNKYGLFQVLIFALIIQLIIIGSLSWKLHWLIIGILLLRSFSMSLAIAPINAVIAPKIDQGQRATYFSIQSLISRLSFALTLYGLSLPFTSGHDTDWPSLQWILFTSFVAGVIASGLLFVFGKSIFTKKA